MLLISKIFNIYKAKQLIAVAAPAAAVTAAGNVFQDMTPSKM